MNERQLTPKFVWLAMLLVVAMAAITIWLITRSRPVSRNKQAASKVSTVSTEARSAEVVPHAKAGAPVASLGSSLVERTRESVGRGMTKGFRFPDYDEQRRLKSMLSGKEARAETGDLIMITGLHVDTYGTDGKVDFIVEAPQCSFDRKNRIASSAGSVEARSADGRFFISGEGFEWRQADAHLFLSNRVHTVLSKELLNTTKPNP